MTPEDSGGSLARDGEEDGRNARDDHRCDAQSATMLGTHPVKRQVTPWTTSFFCGHESD